MNQLNKKSLDQARRAIYQDLPFIFITLDEELGISIQGKEKELEKALRSAFQHNSQFKSIVYNAIRQPKQSKPIRFHQTFKHEKFV